MANKSLYALVEITTLFAMPTQCCLETRNLLRYCSIMNYNLIELNRLTHFCIEVQLVLLNHGGNSEAPRLEVSANNNTNRDITFDDIIHTRLGNPCKIFNSSASLASMHPKTAKKINCGTVTSRGEFCYLSEALQLLRKYIGDKRVGAR